MNTAKAPESHETTTEPPAQSRDEAIQEVRRNTGMAARDLMTVLRGRKRQPVHFCSEGHPVKPGTACAPTVTLPADAIRLEVQMELKGANALGMLAAASVASPRGQHPNVPSFPVLIHPADEHLRLSPGSGPGIQEAETAQGTFATCIPREKIHEKRNQ